MENFVRACGSFKCAVLTYQVMTYPDKINQACPVCGMIGNRVK